MLLFGQDYYQQQKMRDGDSKQQRSVLFNQTIDKIFQHRQFGKMDEQLKQYVQKMQSLQDDSAFIHTDFDSYMEC